MNHFYTPSMEGEKPFKCYVCGKMLITSIEGTYKMKLQCPRCKTKMLVECKEPIPEVLAMKHGELVKL